MALYSCGFAFDSDGSVLLIRKNRPDWQKGLLNGIGGHVEDQESFVDAMVREFEEECGIATANNMWREFASLNHPGVWTVRFFVARDIDIRQAKSVTDERVSVHHNPHLGPGIVPNLSWLIPLALQEDDSRVGVLATYGEGAVEG